MTKSLAIYITFKDLELLNFSKIKYAYMFIVLERLLQFYPTLKKMVVCNVWFMATFWDF
jgi:hypothetical protein